MLKITKRGRNCAYDQKPFPETIDYVSALIEQEDDSLVRQDYCAPCWERAIQETPELASVPHWRGRREKVTPLTAKTSEERNKAMLGLWKEALDKEQFDKAFVIALYLQRQKVLILRKQLKKKFVYEIVASEEMVTTPRINFPKIDVESVRTEIAAAIAPSSSCEQEQTPECGEASPVEREEDERALVPSLTDSSAVSS